MNYKVSQWSLRIGRLAATPDTQQSGLYRYYRRTVGEIPSQPLEFAQRCIADFSLKFDNNAEWRFRGRGSEVNCKYANFRVACIFEVSERSPDFVARKCGKYASARARRPFDVLWLRPTKLGMRLCEGNRRLGHGA